MTDFLEDWQESTESAGEWKERLAGWRYHWHKLNVGSPLPPLLVGLALGILCVISPFLAIIACLACLFFFAAFSKPVLLCYLVVAAIMLTSGIERGRFFPLLSVNEVSLLAAFFFALIIILMDQHRKLEITPYFWVAFIALIGGTVIAPIGTFLLLGTKLTISNAFKMVAPVQYFILFLLFAFIPQNEVQRKRIVWLMLLLGALVAVVGLAQGAGIGVVNRLLGYLFSSSHEAMAARAGRITSLLGSWNTLGIYMMTIIFMCWAMLFETERPRGRLVIMGIMGISVLCLIASGSFAGVIGSVIGLIFMQIISQRRIKSIPVLISIFIGLVLVVLICYPLLQPLIEKRLAYQFRNGGILPQTLTYRFEIWRQIFIPAIKLHFPWPVYPSVPVNYAWQFEESQYILLLFRTGLIGLLGYLMWIGLTIWWLYRKYRFGSGLNKALASTAVTLVVVLVVAGVTNEVFSFAGTIDYLWIMLALISVKPGKAS